MPQAGDISTYIHQGIWTNWSKGNLVGATLTLSPKNALLLISVISIFIQISGTQLWKIILFILHQVRATPEGRDGLYHQQQVILRNTSSELGAIWHLLRVAFAWRTQKTTKSYRRSILLILMASFHFTVFILAGIFSSRLLDAGDEVLIRSPFCGDYDLNYLASLGTTTNLEAPNHLLVAYLANAQAGYQQSQQYVQFCSSPSASCKHLPQDKLPSSWKIEDRCPFQPQMCSQDLNQSIVIDTGLLSSHRHLGLNAPEEDRVQYRKVTTCTILNDAKYITDWKNVEATLNSPAKRVVDAYYGPNRIADRNATYSFSEWSQYYSFDQYSDTNPYQINVQFVSAGDTAGQYSDMIPIPELAREDADTVLFFLSFSKVYESPVRDPWFSAQKASPYPTHDNINIINSTIYTRERPVTTMACTEQHQLCINNDSPTQAPDPKWCTPLSGWYSTSVGPTSVDALNLTARQVATATRVFTAAIDASFFRIVSALNQRDTPLLARRSIQGLIGLGLPDDQWRQETLYWNSIALAHFQRSVVSYSSGSFAADTSYINNTWSPHSRWLCQNQVIRSTIYQSFGFLTIILILIFGTVIIIAGYSIEDCLALWRTRNQRRGHGSPRQDMWVLNEMLEMLSLLYARQSNTIWTHSSNDIPVAGVGQTMKISDLQSGFSPPSPSRQHRSRPENELQEYESKSMPQVNVWPSTSNPSSGSVTPLEHKQPTFYHTPSSASTRSVRVKETEISEVDWDNNHYMQPVRSQGIYKSNNLTYKQREQGYHDVWVDTPRAGSSHRDTPPADWYGRAY